MLGRLVDQQEAFRPGIGVIGKIKIGEKTISKNGKEIPRSLDYFRADAPKQYQDLFTGTFGDKPQKIEIIFISDDLRHGCNLQYELRGDSGKLFARGDGHTFEIFRADPGQWQTITLPEIVAKYGSLEQFKIASEKHCLSFSGWETRLTMRFLIPKIKGLIGEWQLSTKATKSSIGQITGAFDKVMEFAGTVINIPFDLTVEMATSDGYQSAKRYPVLKLIPNASYDNLQVIRSFVEQGLPTWQNGILTEDKILQLKSGKE